MNIADPAITSETPLALPVWMQELKIGLPVRAQFVLSGNLRDVFPTSSGRFLHGFDAIWSILSARKYQALLVFDPVDGLRLHAAAAPDVEARLKAAGVDFTETSTSLENLSQQIALIASLRDIPVALAIDYASQLVAKPYDLTDAERQFFIAADKIALQATPMDGDARPSFNTILWMVDHPNTLPDWFIVGNENVRILSAGTPDLEERFAMARCLVPQFPDAATITPEDLNDALETFALETEGMPLRSLSAIARLAKFEGIALENVSDAIKSYQFGTRNNPWKSEVMRSRIRNGEAILTARVKGQTHAVRKSLDILIRSVMGLSGAQSASRHGRPRGVLFFAGPTGVGKTELAKTITELLFGDETAYHRFDMSEFSSENSESRLIGAPPGYIGHDQGGELVNAARARPFSVFLFDEIEKSHPRILDKFLQIIDEGRLTDGRGETVHFSESLIIFTSNIGILGGDRAMNHGMNIMPTEGYHETERKIVEAIQNHFRFKIERPELLNRIGKNIVVFEFIKGRTSVIIFDNMLRKILEAVEEEHGVHVTLGEDAHLQLRDLCCFDLFDGGRGIGNRLEIHFINPLARLLFERGSQPGDHVEITDVTTSDDNETTLT